MTVEFYLLFRLVMASLLLVVGLGLTFGLIPRKLRSTIFDTSRKVMGIAIITLPIVTIFSYALEIQRLHPHLSAVIYLTAFYIITILTSVSFVSLLGDHIKFQSMRFMRAMVGCLLFPVPLIVTIIFGDAKLIRVMTFVTTALLSGTIIHECVIFYMLYHKGIKRVNNYYSDDLAVNIKWMHNSALAMLSLGVVCSISVFRGESSLWLGVLITIHRVVVYCYVFYTFIKFIITFVEMDKGNVEENSMEEFEKEMENTHNDLDPTLGVGNDVMAKIAENLEVWITERNYTYKGITIISVSRAISTNRTYLSSYINSKYHCSFKVWVTRLRVEDAKRLLTYSHDLSISEIASIVGFASNTSFSHAFKQIAGCTPIRWRQQNPAPSNSLTEMS